MDTTKHYSHSFGSCSVTRTHPAVTTPSWPTKFHGTLTDSLWHPSSNLSACHIPLLPLGLFCRLHPPVPTIYIIFPTLHPFSRTSPLTHLSTQVAAEQLLKMYETSTGLPPIKYRFGVFFPARTFQPRVLISHKLSKVRGIEKGEGKW